MSSEIVNTQTFTNERPPDGVCKTCGKTVPPYLRPAVIELPAKWFKPQEQCGGCLEKIAVRNQATLQQRFLDQAFRSSRVSPRFKQRTIQNFYPTPGTARAFEVAQKYTPKDGGLLFFGPCGVGKTHLAAAIGNKIIGAETTLFISCPDFLLELRKNINTNHPQRYQLLSLAKEVKLLILDDLGAEKGSEWVEETLFVLINYRYEQELPTIITTNCRLDDLEERVGRRITSRLIEMCRCIQMNGEDWRLKKRKQANFGGKL